MLPNGGLRTLHASRQPIERLRAFVQMSAQRALQPVGELTEMI
jgi:hypothetical protein